ncbi:MAG: DMT family transporter [Bacteroidales bacterium]|nr:DMT family transporter [Bacteroidales bacterium]
MKTPVLVYVCILLAMIFWGFSFVWSSIALETLQPFSVLVVRLVIATPLLFLFAFFSGRLQKIGKQDFLPLFLLALFEPFLYFIGETYGLKETTPTVTSVVIATIPLFVPVAAWIFLRDRISIMNFIGIFLSVGGVVVISADKAFILSFSGLMLLLLAVFSAVAYTVTLKKLADKYNAWTLVAYQNLIGIILFLPLFLVFDHNHISISDFKINTIYSLLLLAIFGSSLAFVFFAYSVRHLGVNRSSVFGNLIPVLTAVFAYFVVSEPISWQKILGIIIVVSGVLLSQLKLRQS